MADRAFGIVKVAEEAGFAWAVLHTDGRHPLFHTGVAEVAFVRFTVIFVDEDALVRAGVNAVPRSLTERLINEHRAVSPLVDCLRRAGGYSQIRCGDRAHSPLIMSRSADLVLGMEIHEAARGASLALKKGGTLVFLDVSWQPLPVRLGRSPEITAEEVIQACTVLGAVSIKLELGTLPDAHMQNMALLGAVSKNALIPGVSKQHYEAALDDLLSGDLLKKNRAVLDGFTA